MTDHQNSGHNYNTKIPIKAFENVAKLKYFGMTVSDQNCTHEEIKTRLNLENSCNNSVQNLLSTNLTK
jgi:hypothetical protein